MTRNLGDDLIEGMKEALAYAKGDERGTRVTVVHVPDVKAIREQLGLSQEAFSKTYHIPLATVRGWEQNRRRPDATASAYLTVIAKVPAAIRNAFSA
jgi:putative transcriptional regulator